MTGRSAALVILAAGLAARAATAFAFGVDADSFRLWEYDSTAAHIARGEGHRFLHRLTVYHAYAPPAWSYVLALLLALFGPSVVAIQATQVGCALAAACVFAAVARDSFGARAGVAAGVAVAIEPGLAFYSVAHSDPLAWNVLVLACIVRSGQWVISGRGVPASALFGLAVGVGALSRGTPAAALGVLAALAIRRPGLRRSALVATAVTAACVAPWVVRNRGLTGAWTLTSTTGENLWKGNHPGSSGGPHDGDGSLARNRLPRIVTDALRSPREADHDAAFRKAALAFWVESPGEALALTARKLMAFVVWGEFEGIGYPPWAVVGYRAMHSAVVLLAVAGALRAPRGGAGNTGLLFVAGLYAGIAALQSAFYVEGRHRLLVEPLLIVAGSRLLRSPGGVENPPEAAQSANR